jgi:cellulose synthase/poly-beta-1,6-N-acetylglucosamine synthase-like glycosyltransferase/spore germination protein YaaH/peptidoglycan/xylan/chitin deacetylase (PgdA/CDA1 family)
MSSQPIFYDPKQRRRRRTRQVTAAVVVVTAIMLVLFGMTILRAPLLPTTIGSTAAYGLRPVIQHLVPAKGKTRPRKLLEVKGPGKPRPEPIRAAFYVNWDATSLTGLRQRYKEIDLLIPEWLHLISADGLIRREDDGPVLNWLRNEAITLPVMPMINNFEAAGEKWHSREVVDFLANQKARESFFQQLENYVKMRAFPGVVLDFEEIPPASQPAFRKFVADLVARLHKGSAKVLIALPAADENYDYRFFGQNTDGVILMNYDEHDSESAAGPIASYSWFVANLNRALQRIPPEKLLAGIGGYGYDWTAARKKSLARSITFQEALVTAQEADTAVSLDSDALNPHYEYYDEENALHSVWFLDAPSTYNQVLEADRAGVAGEVIWRLGSEDPTVWDLFAETGDPASHRESLRTTVVPYDLEKQGSGELLKLETTPQAGRRSVVFDAKSGLITAASYDALPVPYTLRMYGAVPGKIVLSFDDGPDPTYTPKILDILRQKNAPAVFFAIGLQADKYSGVLQRAYEEGHEVGNHTFTHPDISRLPPDELEWELTLTQRLFESVLGVKTIFFRPPYNIDADPQTPAEVAPLELIQKLGYFTVGDNIDTGDYSTHDPAKIIDAAMSQLSAGNIILMHDGGGDRSATVAALPSIIDRVREQGKEIVPLRALLAQKGGAVPARALVMPPLDARDRWAARVDVFVFDALRYTNLGIAWIFLAGIFLVSGRLILIGMLAAYQKLVLKPPSLPDGLQPRVAVLIPAYNEEAAIVRTVASVLASTWPQLNVVVVDDGSKDQTHAELLRAFGDDARVKIIQQANGGKSAALNRGFAEITTDFVVCVDADTRIHPDAVRCLVRHFTDPRVAAVAGNAKVGNRHNLLTRWQALEYITSQNLDRRAFHVLNCITVVPGAVGAWRTSVVRECGGFSHDTVAEDADLTLAILRRGHRIAYDEDAVAWTEAPETWGDLVRQRFRWTFGTLQTVWKHRDTLFRPRYGTLGWIALPNVFVFQILLPMFSPTVDLMLVGSFFFWAANLALERWPLFSFPQALAVSTENLERTLLFFLIFTCVDLLACELAFLMEKKESQLLLVWLLPQRFAYRQMMYWILFRVVLRAIQGSAVGWGRVERAKRSPA